MDWGTVSQTRIWPWGEVKSWTGGVDEFVGDSCEGSSATSGTLDMTEASLGGRVSSMSVSLDDTTHT
jgi:hypothetical protein